MPIRSSRSIKLGLRYPKQPPAEPEPDGPEWIWVGDQRMFVVGYTAGGAPFGYVEGLDDLADTDPEDVRF